MNQQSDSQKARNSVWYLLKIRLRSEHELREKLKLKKFSPDVINETIQYFYDLDFINDRTFAKSWINSRLKKPYGFSRIKNELRIKGIDPVIIDQECAVAGENYNEIDVLTDLARKRRQKYKNLTDDKIKKRLYDYLCRRGFNQSTIYQVILNK